MSKLKEDIYVLIKELKGVSFVNLCEKVEGFSGDLAMVSGTNPHIIYWNGVSKEAIDALSEIGRAHV